jgi:hypothetical protein
MSNFIFLFPAPRLALLAEIAISVAKRRNWQSSRASTNWNCGKIHDPGIFWVILIPGFRDVSICAAIGILNIFNHVERC